MMKSCALVAALISLLISYTVRTILTNVELSTVNVDIFVDVVI